MWSGLARRHPVRRLLTWSVMGNQHQHQHQNRAPVCLSSTHRSPSPSFTQDATGMSVLPQDLHLLHHARQQQEHVAEKTNASVRKARSAAFDRERERQLGLIPRVEKITVKYMGIPEDRELVMNKRLSTPYNVAQRKCSGRTP